MSATGNPKIAGASTGEGITMATGVATMTDLVVQTYRFTVADYHLMGEAGIFREDERVELLDGQVVEMWPIGSRHAVCVRRLNALFTSSLVGRATVGIQDPVFLDEYSEPEPDLVVMSLDANDYGHGHPRPEDVHLLIEVGDSSVSLDRLVKIPLYARAGVPEVWLVDLPKRQVEIFREPRSGRYTRQRIVPPTETIVPAAFPEIEVVLTALLPPEAAE